MLISFIEHSIKDALRKANFNLKLILKVISIVSIAYLFLALIYLGYDFIRVLRLFNSTSDPITIVNYKLLHLCAVLFIALLFSLQNPLKALLPYLHLPIKRSKLVLYILFISLFNYLLIGLLLFFVPYSIRVILPNYNHQQFLFYLFGILIIFISVGYLSLLIRNLIGISFVFIIVPVLMFIVLYLSDLILDVSFTTISVYIFNRLINKDFYFLILLIVVLALLLSGNFLILKKGFYRIYQNQKLLLNYTVSPIKDSLLRNNLFTYAELEIKLITRNRRLKGFFLIAAFLLIMFYIIFPRNDEGLIFTFLVYILITGMFGYMFLQYLFSWESSYYDFIASTRFDIIKYLKAKYLIYLFLSLIVFLVFLPVIKPSKNEVHMFLSALLYNLSFGYLVSFFLATYNKSKIDLNGTVFFNLQGFNSTQLLGIMIIMLIPCFFLFLLLLALNLTQSLLIINFLCIVALINHKKGWQIIYKKLLLRKYINLEGYRE